MSESLRALTFIACALIFSLSVNAQEFPVLPNVLSALNGYDIVMSSPFGAPDSPVDPGARRPVFAAQYARNTTAVFNGITYSVPDGIDAPTPAHACAYSSSYSSFSVLTSAAEFQSTMRQFSVGASLGSPPIAGFGATAFTGSGMFQGMWASVGDIVVSNFATCAIFSAFTDTATPPPITSEFAARVAALDPSSSTDLFAFSHDFGTHYMTETVFGGIAYTYTRITEVSYLSLNAQSFAYSEAAGLMFLEALGADVSHSSAYAAYQMLNVSSVQKTSKLFTAPVAPPIPANVDAPDANAWQALIDVDSKVGPAVISIPSLAPLAALLTTQNFPADPEIKAKADALLAYLSTTYCTDLNPYPGCTYETANPIVALFSSSHCPPGWVVHGPSAGRVIFAADGSPAYPSGVVNGNAMESLVAPVNTHAYTDSFSLGLHGLNAARGGGFNILGAGQYTYSSPLAQGPGFPLVQVTACTNANASTVPIAPIVLPTNAGVFFDSDTGKCPPHTIPTPLTAGYTPVSGSVLLPDSPPLHFGAAITHSHAVNGYYGLPGACTSFCPGGNDGGSAQGNPSSTNPQSDTAPALPYITMLMCTSVEATSVDTTPPGMLIFSQTEDCSDLGTDWSPYTFFDGLLIAGTPLGGKPGIFGDISQRLSDSDTKMAIPHSHTLVTSAVTSTPGCVSFVADGCNQFHFPCNEGYKCVHMVWHW